MGAEQAESDCIVTDPSHHFCAFFPLPSAVSRTASGLICRVLFISPPSVFPPYQVEFVNRTLNCTIPGDIPLIEKNVDECASENCAGTNPINIALGNKYQVELDYSGLGRYPLRLLRTYNSGTLVTVSYSAGWRGSYSRSVRDGGTSAGVSSVNLDRGDGKQFYFSRTGGGAPWIGDADTLGTLVQLVDAGGNT